jgi:hypothetical protein
MLAHIFFSRFSFSIPLSLSVLFVRVRCSVAFSHRWSYNYFIQNLLKLIHYSFSSETEALIKEENRVPFIQSQRLAWYGHVNRMEDNKNVKAIMKWNPIDRRLRGRPKTRWKDDVEADLRAMKITNWKTRIEDKVAWKKIVEQAKTHPGL